MRGDPPPRVLQVLPARSPDYRQELVEGVVCIDCELPARKLLQLHLLSRNNLSKVDTHVATWSTRRRINTLTGSALQGILGGLLDDLDPPLLFRNPAYAHQPENLEMQEDLVQLVYRTLVPVLV